MKKLISIVVPMFNESENIAYFYARVSAVLAELAAYDFEIICVNDGSQDDTWGKLEKLSQTDARIKAIDLSRNFGK
ncbi:MAG: glycosyltransferase, partial [Sporomusaceae bacterium]|nr:glycosyltransferase [Sporomusaceae bacterium]